MYLPAQRCEVEGGEAERVERGGQHSQLCVHQCRHGGVLSAPRRTLPQRVLRRAAIYARHLPGMRWAELSVSCRLLRRLPARAS